MSDKKKEKKGERPKRTVKKVSVRRLTTDELDQVAGGGATSGRSLHSAVCSGPT